MGSSRGIRRGSDCFIIILSLALAVAGLGAAAPRPECEQLLTRKNFEDLVEIWKTKDYSSEKLTEVFEAATEHLKAQGVAFHEEGAETGHAVLVIEPDSTAPTRLNHWAESLWRKHGTRFVFDPAEFAARSSLASFLPPTRTRNNQGLIRVPIESLFDAQTMSSSLAHEIIHSVTTWHLARRDPFDFYGRVWARTIVDPKLAPELVIPGAKKSYRTQFSFDEVATHYGQSRFLLNQAKRAREAGDEAPAAELEKSARARLKRGLRLARQVERLAAESQRTLASSSDAVEYDIKEGLIWAKISFVLDGVELLIRMPLIESQAMTDSRNAAFLDAQLGRLRAAAQARVQGFEALLKTSGN